METFSEYIECFMRFTQNMMENFEIKSIIAFILTYFSTIFGQDWWLIQSLFAFIFMDIFLGMFNAIKFNGGFSYTKLHQGVLKFFAYGLTIIMVFFIQKSLTQSLSFEIPILALYATYQCITELASISKHLLKLGIPLPTIFVKLLVNSKSKIEDTFDTAFKKDENNVDIENINSFNSNTNITEIIDTNKK